MEGLVSFGNKKTYDDFKKQIPIIVQPLFENIRKFCLALGNNVVEDVRMHRIVFGKSFVFRWFADLEPEENGIIVKIQKNHKESPRIINVKVDQKTTELEENLRKAFEEIH